MDFSHLNELVIIWTTSVAKIAIDVGTWNSTDAGANGLGFPWSPPQI